MKTKELELSEKIERRLEMIHAHTKLEKTIREVIKEFGVCQDTYYYWYHRYVEKGIFGFFNFKRGPKTAPNKTSDGVASKIAETADYHPELDAAEILEVLDCSPEHKPSVATAQRILRSAGMNCPKGRRSKKTMEKKKTTIQAHKKVLKKGERIVKQNGKVKFKGKWYHMNKKMSNETVEVKITLRGAEAWHKGAFIKRWKYWEYVLGIAADYMPEKCLL